MIFSFFFRESAKAIGDKINTRIIIIKAHRSRTRIPLDEIKRDFTHCENSAHFFLFFPITALNAHTNAISLCSNDWEDDDIAESRVKSTRKPFFFRLIFKLTHCTNLRRDGSSFILTHLTPPSRFNLFHSRLNFRGIRYHGIHEYDCISFVAQQVLAGRNTLGLYLNLRCYCLPFSVP